MESEQYRKTYRENGKNTGISLGYDISSGKVSGLASAGKSHTDSDYESVTNQAGIYAGDKGFDITVEDNTHLKGAVIDSKGDAEKNTLRTGTLSWEDVENKADYRLSGKGIAVNKTPNAPYNEKGITPAIPTGSSGKADSTTRAGIAPGTIMIQDKDNQRQDTTALNRNTRDSLNKLGEIFNKTKVEERQELAGLFGKLAFNYLHDAKLTPNQRAAWHAAIGGIMGQLSNKNFMAGALPAGINEMMIGEIQKAAHGDPALMQWIGACVGAVTGQLVSRHSQLGGSAAASGVKNNSENEIISAQNIAIMAAIIGITVETNNGLNIVKAPTGEVIGYLNDAGNIIYEGIDELSYKTCEFIINNEEWFPEFIVLQARQTEKEKASDIPSWVAHEGYSPLPGESGKEFAKRVLDDRYGAGNYPTGPGSEYNKLKKHIDRDKSIKRTGEKDE